MRDAHDDTPKADIRDKQRHSHAPKRSPPLGFEPRLWVRKSPATVVVGLLSLERTTGRPRIRFADPHRLRPPAGVLASSLQTLRVCLTLAPSRVRAQAMGTKKPGYRSSRAAEFGADNGASAYPLRGSAPASAACRRPRQLATNAPRLLNARSLSGSSPSDGYEKARLP